MSRVLVVVLIVVLVLVVLPGGCLVSTYNGLIGEQEAVTAAWSQIDNMYKRRFDLVPQLVETVKGAADFERSTLDAVISARASVGQAQLPAGMPTDPQQLAAYLEAQRGLSGALGRLFAVAENYPQLRATQGFLDLQAQIEGSENRIATARTDFIEATRRYNTSRRRFPGSLVASFYGFEEAAILEMDPAERERPVIDFGGQGG